VGLAVNAGVYGDESSAFLLQERKRQGLGLFHCGAGVIEIWVVEYSRKGHSQKI